MLCHLKLLDCVPVSTCSNGVDVCPAILEFDHVGHVESRPQHICTAIHSGTLSDAFCVVLQGTWTRQRRRQWTRRSLGGGAMRTPRPGAAAPARTPPWRAPRVQPPPQPSRCRSRPQPAGRPCRASSPPTLPAMSSCAATRSSAAAS